MKTYKIPAAASENAPPLRKTDRRTENNEIAGGRAKPLEEEIAAGRRAGDD